MQLNDLRPNKGAKKARKRIGRGNASGHGTTAGRGTKGQLSRSGGVKVLGDGELTKKLTVKVDKVSPAAQAKIEAAGGKVELPC